MGDPLEYGNAGDIFADTRGPIPEAGFVAPAGIGDVTHSGSGQQPTQRSVSLEAVVWAPPVFVVGCPRSGTTLVQTMLDYHPSLNVLYEAHVLVDIPLGLRSSAANALKALSLAEADPNFREHGFDARAAGAACEELGITDAAGAMRVLAASHALERGKRRWGTKLPKALLHLAELALVYPDAQFIHVIRDGRESARSQARVSDRNIFQGALIWRTGIRTGRRVGPLLGPDRYLEVRFEEFLFSPEEQIRRMCAFLGEDFDDSLLSFNATARERVPLFDLPIHPRLGEPVRPLPPCHDGAAAGLAQRAVAALIEPELVELGYATSALLGHRRRIDYVVMGYAMFFVSLWRSWRELFRYLARAAGARRIAGSVERQSSAERAHLSEPRRHEQPGTRLPQRRVGND